MFKKLTAGRLTRRVQPDVDGKSTGLAAGPDTTDRESAGATVPVARSATGSAPTETPTTDTAATNSLNPSAPPDYFALVPHYASSPLPRLAASGRVIPGTGMRKFVDALPGVGREHANDLGNYLPVAVPDTITYPGSDYYEIGLQEYAQRLHTDLPPTRLRGYRQLNSGTDGGGRNTVAPPDRPGYLGPIILAHRDRPVRVKFVNQLPTGAAGRLFLPVDPTVSGAAPAASRGAETYPENRAVPHLRGALVPWISAGSPRQWCAPAGEDTTNPRGTSGASVPDLPDPEDGAITLYYPNQQSGRLLWFHDHAEGVARLNVYAGQLGLYLLDDPVERQLIADGVLPVIQIPLVIQDKTFVPDEAQLAAQDPTWDVARWGGPGSLWYPHVYLPRQNPRHESGRNPVGRWDYGPWCRPPGAGFAHGPVPNPYHDPVARPTQPPLAPGTPTPSLVPDAYLDTPVINGTAYPYLRVRPRAYRFRILNACGDRALNLQLYRAASDGRMWGPDGALRDGDAGEVPMVPAAPNPGFPPRWPTDGRAGGVPDPAAAGPDLIQIGTEGGLLPAPVVLSSQPINYELRRREGTVLNVTDHALLLGPGERADVIIDFSSVPPGSNLILYNDAPAPMPAFDPRYDHYTDGPDLRDCGGPPSTRPGWGPNTRTLLQFQVVGAPAPPFDLATLRARLPEAYAASQPPPIVPERAYDAAFGTDTPAASYAAAQDSVLTFTPPDGGGPVTLPLRPKVIRQLFEPEYGRATAALGVELPDGGGPSPTTTPLSYVDPPTEALHPSDPATPVGVPGDGTQLWRIINQGPDTHFVHFGFANVQLVNRVGWDGTIRPPEDNELGWKETVRMDPRQDVIIALRPTGPGRLPFKLGDSVRLHDPTLPPGATRGLAQINPGNGQPVMVTNRIANYGWEYVWHSHLAGQHGDWAARPVVLRVGPAQPTGLTATPAAGTPTVSPTIGLIWTNNAASPPARVNVIERAVDAAFTTDLVRVSVAATRTTYTDSGVTPRTTYHYRVRAENAAGYSGWSNLASAAVQPLTPTALSATISTDPPPHTVLTWTNQSFATGVEIQRATNPTFTSGLVTVSSPVVSNHVDGTVTPDTTYYYRVRTCYLGTASSWSNISMVIVPDVPAVPAGLTATVSTSAPDTVAVALAWTQDSTGVVTGFVLQRATDPVFASGLRSLTITGTARTCTVTDVARGSTYYYRIQARNPAGASGFTDPVRVTTP